MKTKKGLGKVLREISINPFRLEGSSESLIGRATIPPGYEWFSLDESSELVVRSCYDLVWKEVERAFIDRISKRKEGKEASDNRVLILGNSGIGKTASMNYYIIQALRKNYPVLIETRELRYFIDSHSDDVQYEKLNSSTGLVDKRDVRSVLLFHDHQPNTEPPILDTGAFTVAPVSPAEANMKEFVKHKCLELWMPIPTLQEIIAMKGVIAPDMKDIEFQRRLSIVGNLPRLVFNSNFPKVMEKLNSRIASFDVNSFITSTMFSEGLIPRDRNGLSWWIVRVSGGENLDATLSMSWGSDYIRDRVLKAQASKNLNSLKVASCMMLTSPFADERPTGYYERWCVYSLAAGKELRPKIGDIDTKSVKLNARNLVVRSTLPNFTELANDINRVYYCAGVNNPSYDAAVLYRPAAGGELQLLLIQVTIGKTHKDFPTGEELEDNSTGKKREDFSDKAHIVTAAKKKVCQLDLFLLSPVATIFASVTNRS